jgi:hypothetical protein
MRVLLAVLLLFSTTVNARAQQSWQDPHAFFEAIIPAGWEEVEGTVPVSGERLLAIQSQAMREHRPAPRSVFIRECSISRTFHADMRKSQTELNATLEDGQLLEFLIRMAMPIEEHARSNEIEGGVRVVSYDIDIDPSRGLLATVGRVMQPDRFRMSGLRG